MNGFEFFGNATGDVDVDAVVLLAHQGFARDLQENSAVGTWILESVIVFGFGHELDSEVTLAQQRSYFVAEIIAAAFESFTHLVASESANRDALAGLRRLSQ